MFLKNKKGKTKMNTMTCSFTLGNPSQANIGHNNREFYASNVDKTKTENNIIYKQQDVRAAYDELFAEALKEYNAKRSADTKDRHQRTIKDYYEHISKGKREEAFYEIVVQFGDRKNKDEELMTAMLNDYMRDFEKRNPNLHIFNAVLHLDEATPHLHIDFIPFTTEHDKNYGLSKCVSMKGALIQQGFKAKNSKENQLVDWENSEREVMNKILEQHNLQSTEKQKSRPHLTVDDFKRTQDAFKLLGYLSQIPSEQEITAVNVRNLKSKIGVLENENVKLKNSEWMHFFYSSEEKRNFVIAELAAQNINVRETENGFECLECFKENVRIAEKKYKPQQANHRTKLKADVDKIIMLAKNYEDFLNLLKKYGYEIKQGKFLAVKPQFGLQFIRLKSLGEDYTEMAIKNHINEKNKFEKNVDEKINSKENNPYTILIFRTIKQYTIAFSQNALPMKKHNNKKYFTWSNDENLNKLLTLNKAINSGNFSLENMREQEKNLIKNVSETQNKIIEIENDLNFYKKMLRVAQKVFVQNQQYTPEELKFLQDNKITKENIPAVEKFIEKNQADIESLKENFEKNKSLLEKLTDEIKFCDEVFAKTYVQKLMQIESDRQTAEYRPKS
jgi:hypothetical protein